MSKLSYKSLLIIFFFLLIGVVILSRFILPKQKVSAAWWNESWSYRKAVSINNSSGSNLTDFQISISIGTSALIASGKMQSDCDDIRITDINGNILPYWIEENNPGCNQTADTKIWIKASSLPTSGSLIYFYYGNSQANNNENGENVFEFFDNFENGIGKWIAETGVSMSITTESSSKILSLSTVSNFLGAFAGNETMSDYYVESRLKTSDRRVGLYTRHKSSNNTDNGYYLRTEADNFGYSQNDGAPGAYGSAVLDPNTWYNLKILAIGTSASLFLNDVNQNINQTLQNTTGNIGISPIETAVTYYDYVFVRKYASSQPTPSIQSEELSPAPIAYWKFDEGSGTTTYNSSGTNNGTLLGSTLPTWQNEDQCISGKCLLNTNGYVSVNNLWTNFQNSSFSISSWVYFNDNSASDRSIVSIGSAGTDTQLHLVRRNNKIYFAFWGDDYSGNKTIEPNIWYHISVTWDSNTKQQNIYVNGVLDKSRTSSGSLNVPNSSLLFIGLYAANSTNGYIDDFKIYPYARTANQIKQDYNSRGSSKSSSVNLGIKSSTAPSLKSKLVGHWKFDEGNGIIANNSTNYGSLLNGTLQSGSSIPTWSNNGKINKALNFLGNDNSYVSISDAGTSSPLDLTDEFTISGWIKIQTLTTYDSLLYKFGSYSILPWGDGTVRFYANNGSWGEKIRSNSTIATNKWTYVSVTYSVDNSSLKIYINGKLDKEVSISTPISVNNNALYIGKGYTAENGNMNGLIDEVKIYNTALTDEEIKQDYNQGSAAQFGSTSQTIGGTTTSLEYCIPGDTSYCASPVAEWKMDEGIGTSTVDSSGNNFTGTISNANWSQGKIGKSLNFNGESSSAYISTQYPSSSPTSFTAEAWIKPNSVSGTGDHSTYGYTIMAASADGSRYPVWITLRNGEIRASVFVDTLTYTETVGANIQTNNWYHVAVSAIQNSTATIYINGIKKTSFTAGNIAWNTADKLTIADLRPTRNISFNGSIDHFKIYDYARTPAQIAYDYNKGGPVGWWKFDECQGNIVYDWSGIGNTGSINIGPSGYQNSLGACQIGTSAAWTNGATGKINSSLNFDGSDDYIAFNKEIIGSWPQLSYSAWFKTTSSGYFTLLGDWSGGASFIAHLQSGKFNLYLSTSGTSPSWQNAVSPVVNDGLWHHIAVSYNGIFETLYIDGIQKFQTQATGNMVPNSSYKFKIGAYANGSEVVAGFFPGHIDDVRIYNYALTPEQIKQVYNGGAVNFQ